MRSDAARSADVRDGMLTVGAILLAYAIAQDLHVLLMTQRHLCPFSKALFDLCDEIILFPPAC